MCAGGGVQPVPGSTDAQEKYDLLLYPWTTNSLRQLTPAAFRVLAGKRKGGTRAQERERTTFPLALLFISD